MKKATNLAIDRNDKKNKGIRMTGVLLLVLGLVFMQSGWLHAQSPSQNYSAVKGTIGASAAMYGAAAAAGVCTVVTAGMCGAIVGGVVLGGAAATLGMFPTPPPDLKGPNPSQMPDGDDVGGGNGSDGCGEGGDIGPFGLPSAEMFGCAW